MVSTILVLVVVTSLLALAWSLLRSGHSEIRSIQDWEERKHEVDIQIVRLLIDPDEETYLRDSLTRDQFRAFQKTRVRLALRILRLVEENASMSMRLGQLAKAKGDPVLTQRANELIATATQVRLSLLTVKRVLSLKLLLPSTMSVPAFEVRYRDLLDCQLRVQQYSRDFQI
jgi:hypothetical protein